MKRRKFMQTMAAGVVAHSPFQRQTEKVEQQFRRLRRRLDDATDEEEFWARVQKCFLLDPQIIHLNCGSIGATPEVVVSSLNEFTREIEKNPHENFWGDGLGQQLESVRTAAAKFIHASLEEISLTRNTTEGMNRIAGGLDLAAGDEILTSNHEHPGGIVGWQHLEKHKGVKIVRVKFPTATDSHQEMLKRIRQNITRRTKVFSFCHIDTITGTVMPIQSLVKMAREHRAFFVCDGAQAPGMIPVDVKKLGVDAYVSSSHKWMLAPKGSGLLYIREKSKPQVHAMAMSWGFKSYNASVGTRDIAHLLAHGIAMRFHQTIGPEKIAKRVRELNAYLADKLSSLPGLKRMTHTQDFAGIVTFAVDRKIASSHEIVEQLKDKHRVYVKATQHSSTMERDKRENRTDYNALRFSTHIFNRKDQIDRAVKWLAAMLADVKQ